MFIARRSRKNDPSAGPDDLLNIATDCRTEAERRMLLALWGEPTRLTRALPSFSRADGRGNRVYPADFHAGLPLDALFRSETDSRWSGGGIYILPRRAIGGRTVDFLVVGYWPAWEDGRLIGAAVDCGAAASVEIPAGNARPGTEPFATFRFTPAGVLADAPGCARRVVRHLQHQAWPALARCG